jgi:hypothetical protein
MNKYISHIIALVLGSSLALAAPQTLLTPAENHEDENKPMCQLTPPQSDECEVIKPEEEEKKSSSFKASVIHENQKYQKLIQKEILRSMIEPVSFQAP